MPKFGPNTYRTPKTSPSILQECNKYVGTLWHIS